MAEWWRRVMGWLGGGSEEAVAASAVPSAPERDRADLALARGHTLAIRHVFPPVLPARSMSFLGGDPLGPDDLDVPMVVGRDGLIEALTFVAQLDLSRLPDGPARHLLPSDGYLYFFAPMSGNLGPDALRHVCRYVPGRATTAWGPQPRLASAPIMDAAGRTPWLGWHPDRDRAAPRSYHRVEIELGWLAPAGEVEPGDADADTGFPWEVAEQRRRDALIRFHGPPIEPSARLRPPLGAVGEEPWIPFPEFPENVRAAQILGGFVRTWLQEEERAAEGRLGELSAEDPARPALEATREALRAFGRVHAEGLRHAGDPPEAWARPLPAQRRQDVLSMLKAMRSEAFPAPVTDRARRPPLPWRIDQWIAQAAVHSAEEALTDATGAAALPPEVVEALRARHDVRGHQLLGAGVVVQEAGDEMATEHVLLLQLVPDRVVGWDHGELGALQYWIRPADLRARRFEATLLTMEAY